MTRTWIDETVSKIGETVVLKGWVHRLRKMGDKLVFIDLRDGSGLAQVVFYKPDLDEATCAAVDELKPEFVIEVEGVVNARGAKQVNPDMLTGTIEIGAKALKILNAALTPPFPVDQDSVNVAEHVRMKYRYLDLRTDRLQHHLRLRSRWVQACREYLFANRFVEIETPLLTKATPEGSRDFVVPSRLQPGKFFALPQSPQQYKQLLMCSSFERYFQTARALRDEDPRADRGFEHTQVDIEMSFVEREDVMNMVEGMVTAAAEKLGFTIREKPFPRITYKESMAKYGADKFDMRTEKEKAAGVLAYVWVIDFPFFERDTKSGRWTFTHNPFSNPLPEFREDHLAGRNIENILTSQYDLVCNGYESGGGSIRAHEANVLEATYRTMGYSKEELEGSVGHMLEAFRFGAPPHGGIGLGVERNIMNLTGESALREVVAFPMTASGTTSVMEAPSALDVETLLELHLKTIEKKR
ncbi:aspartate--tRNA ligase [Candidatus Uhrbacteria bacterium]|nr:aspartate--tRNA ligase [Candidatus Uhrbacteria bacterium]